MTTDNRIMTYEQAKDQIAKKYDWRDWNELLYWHDKPENSFQKEDVDKYYTPEAAELYADSVARDFAKHYIEMCNTNDLKWFDKVNDGKGKASVEKAFELWKPEYQPK